MVQELRRLKCIDDFNNEFLITSYIALLYDTMDEALDSFFTGEGEKSIVPMNFGLAITLNVTLVILNFINIFFVGYINPFLDIVLTYSVCVIIFIYLKIYLSNFNAIDAIKKVNWNIIIYIVTALLMLIGIFYTPDTQEDSTQSINDLIGGAIVYLIFYLPFIIVAIFLGVALKKIENDFIGNLKTLGASYIIITPIMLLLSALELIYDTLFLQIVVFISSIVSPIILSRILWKARNYNRNMELS